MKQQTLIGKTILLVHTGGSKKRFIFKKLKKLGLNIIVLNKEKNWAQPYVDHWILADPTNYNDSLRAVRNFIKDTAHPKIDGVLTFWEESVVLVSKIADAHALIGIPTTVTETVRNKFSFREFCEKQGLPAPRHMLIRTKEDIKTVGKLLRYPLVIKPIYGSSSAFVVKVEDHEELIETYDYIKHNLLNHPDAHEWDNLDILVEEYIDGDEVDIDILVQNGKVKYYSITDNYRTEEPFFIETGMAIPSSLPVKNQEVLVDMAEEVLEKLGVQNGCIHFEAKLTKSGPVPIEVNLRMGGDEVYSFSKEAWGVDLIENAVAIVCGVYISKIIKPDAPRKYLVGEDFLSEHSGVVSKVVIDPKLLKKKYLEQLHFYKDVGDAVMVPPEGYEYLGWITVSGDNPLDAQDNLKEALKFVRYEVARFHAASLIGKTLRKSHRSYARVNNLLRRAARIASIQGLSKEELRKLHIGIACNVYDSEEFPVEYELTQVGRIIQHVLEERGYRVSFFDFNNIVHAMEELRKSDVDLVFNLCERINNSSLLEPNAAALLDILQIPYTGSNPATLSICIDKIRVKKLLAYHGIPTPKWDYVYSITDPLRNDLRYPLIVKPGNSDNSIGITNDSVVTNRRELRKQIKRLVEEHNSPALIEEYIEGDEYDVSILGSEEDDLCVLPLSRSVFTKLPEGYWHIFPFEAKWGKDTVYHKKVVIERPPKRINKKLEALISEIALDTYSILDCHDYGRVEIRVDKDNNPYVLELNPNPSINEENCVPSVAKLTGMNYGDFIEEIIRLAIKRYKDKQPYAHLQATL